MPLRSLRTSRSSWNRALAAQLAVCVGAATLSPAFASAAPPAKPSAPAAPVAPPPPPPGTYADAPVEVLSFASNDAVDEAAALTDAFKHALLGVPGLPVGTKALALEAVALSIGCDDPMVPACAPKLVNEVKSERFFYGIVKKTPPNKLTATVVFYANGQTRTAVKTYDAGPVARDGAAPELKKLATDMIVQLAGTMIRAKVDLTVTGEAASEKAEVFENGQKIGDLTAGRGSVELAPGNHTLEVHVKGYAAASASADVSLGGGAASFTPVKLSSDPEAWKTYAGWGGVGVGGVLLILGVVSSIQVGSDTGGDFKRYSMRFSSQSNVDICQQASLGIESGPGYSGQGGAGMDPLASKVRSTCDDLKGLVVKQVLFYSLGGVLAAGGTYLLVTKKKGERTTASADSTVSLSVSPSLDRNFSGLSLVGSF